MENLWAGVCVCVCLLAGIGGFLTGCVAITYTLLGVAAGNLYEAAIALLMVAWIFSGGME